MALARRDALHAGPLAGGDGREPELLREPRPTGGTGELGRLPGVPRSAQRLGAEGSTRGCPPRRSGSTPAAARPPRQPGLGTSTSAGSMTRRSSTPSPGTEATAGTASNWRTGGTLGAGPRSNIRTCGLEPAPSAGGCPTPSASSTCSATCMSGARTFTARTTPHSYTILAAPVRARSGSGAAAPGVHTRAASARRAASRTARRAATSAWVFGLLEVGLREDRGRSPRRTAGGAAVTPRGRPLPRSA